MTRLIIRLAIFAAFFCISGTAIAASYRLDFSGTVTNSSESFTGYAILDYSTPNSSNDPSSGYYENVITEFELEFGGARYTLEQAEINGVTVSNDDEFFGFDAFGISLYLTDTTVDSGFELFFLQLIDPTMTVFDGIELPTSLSIDDFDLDQSDVTNTYVSTDYSHPIDFVSIAPVPLPAGLPLLLSGLSAIFAIGYGRRWIRPGWVH